MDLNKLMQKQAEAHESLKQALETKASSETIEKIQKALDDIEVKMQRANTQAIKEEIKGQFKVDKEHKSAFEKFARQGEKNLTAEERKTMFTSNDTTGGYLASFEYDNQIIKNLVEMSPVRRYARVTPTSKRGVHVPVRTGTPTAYWTSEGEDMTNTKSTYGLKELENHSMTAKITIHQDDLDDSDFNLESELVADATEQFAVLEGQAFLTGDTKKKPEGLLFNDKIVEVESAGVGVIEGDDLVDLFYSIKSGYSANGVWFLNRNTIKAVRKLKDNEGRYLWTPMGGLDGLPYNSILGRPYVEIPDMPDIATGATPIAFGDIQRAYRISDRKGIETVRDNMTLAGKREVIFYMHKRVGGMVVLPEAVAKLKIK